MIGYCEFICSHVDYFFTLFIVGTNKLLMIYLIVDRLLDVQLHMRYPLYFTKKTVRKILLAIWLCCAIFSLTLVLFKRFDIGSSESRGMVVLIYLLGSDAVIVTSALVTYGVLYRKVRRFNKVDRKQQRAGRNGNLKRDHASKFLLPCLLIATYLAFNTTADLMIIYKYRFMRKSHARTLVSEIGHWLWILGFISDGALYIFLQKDIKKKLKSIFRRKQFAKMSTKSESGFSQSRTRSSTIYTVSMDVLMY